jgi:hypothetical protein
MAGWLLHIDALCGLITTRLRPGKANAKLGGWMCNAVGIAMGSLASTAARDISDVVRASSGRYCWARKYVRL